MFGSTVCQVVVFDFHLDGRVGVQVGCCQYPVVCQAELSIAAVGGKRFSSVWGGNVCRQVVNDLIVIIRLERKVIIAQWKECLLYTSRGV